MLAVRELCGSLVLTIKGKLSECQDSSQAERYSCFTMLTASRWVQQLTSEQRVWKKEKKRLKQVTCTD